MPPSPKNDGSSPKAIAIIPARGGSKRIPRKNIKKFCGKPIIAYSIEVAYKSGLFSTVMVSTDSEEIVKVAEEYGADVPFMRSKETSSDFAILSAVFDEVVNKFARIGKTYDTYCLILPTAPHITTQRLNQGLKMLLDNNFDSVRPIIRFSSPIQRAFRYSDGKVTMFNPENYNKRSQDLEPAYHDAGQFYWVKKGAKLSSGNKGAIVIPENEAQDIDNYVDWLIAEMKYKLLFGKS